MASSRLTASTTGDILTAATLLSTGDINTFPSPAGAAAATAQNVNISSRAADTTGDTIDGKTGNGDAGGGCTGRTAVLVVLLDDDAVFGDAGECDVLVGYAGDGAGGAIDGFDTDAYLRTKLVGSKRLKRRRRTVLGVLDGGVFDVDGLDGVVGATSNGTNGQSMTTGASTASEDNVLQLSVWTRLDRKKENFTVPELTAKQSS
jgi:hypothetical protein